MLNKVMVIGHLGADPEMRYTASGDAVTTFRVASSERWTDKAGAKQERTEWVSVVAWRKLAEICAQYLATGRQVYVEGRLQTRSWDDQAGQKKYRTEVVASQVTFLGGAGAGDGQRPARAAAGAPTADSGGDIDPDDLPF